MQEATSPFAFPSPSPVPSPPPLPVLPAPSEWSTGALRDASEGATVTAMESHQKLDELLRQQESLHEQCMSLLAPAIFDEADSLLRLTRIEQLLAEFDVVAPKFLSELGRFYEMHNVARSTLEALKQRRVSRRQSRADWQLQYRASAAYADPEARAQRNLYARNRRRAIAAKR